MKKNFLYIILTFLSAILLFGPSVAAASGISDRLSGRIVLDVERNGEAWYIYPEDKKRYFLGRPVDAFDIMRELGLGIAERDFQRIAQAGMPVEGDRELAKRLSGKIVIRTNFHGEAWYINPEDLRKYYLGRPSDAFNIMRELGLGITRLDLARVHKNGLDESCNEHSDYKYKKRISTPKGVFYADIVRIDLDNPRLRVITDTADDEDCKSGCSARSLGEFVLEHDGFAGINATYFNTSASERNYYFFPVYNSGLDRMINRDQLKYWTTGPMVAFDKNNNFYYFKDSRDFKSVEYFEGKYDTELQAALGNKPRLIEEGMNLLIDWELDDYQGNIRSWRNALAYKDEDGSRGELFLVAVRQATVPDLADVLKALKADYALNLDGGYSASLFYNDEYMIGPGRDIPNALIFKEEGP